MIRRERHIRALRGLLKRSPVVAILGARQVGKTTLARQFQDRWKGPVHWYDLEDPADLSRLDEPTLSLRRLSGLVVIDEIHRRPDLFPSLRVLADRPGRPARFLLLGSASPHLLRQSSESLAGRVAYWHLGGFALDEVGPKNTSRLWIRGGFPRSFVARSDAESSEWRREFIKTFLERDLPQLGVTTSSSIMRRFWTMLAHFHGQVWNASELARSLGTADSTARTYLDHLAAAFVVRQLPPWHENIGKRQLKAPKIYLSDSGILHALLGLESYADVEAHPKLGASWEGVGIESVISTLGARPEECYFWATHSGAELDLLIVRGRRRRGFEIKRTDAPSVTRSMRVALHDLKLDRLEVIHGGAHSFPLDDRIHAVALERVLSDLKKPL